MGGTFTDFVCRSPDGRIRTLKLLSSGVVRGRADRGSSEGRVVDPALSRAPEGFFKGWRLAAEGAGSGRLSARDVLTGGVEVAGFDRERGSLALARPFREAPPPGARYALCCGEETPVTGIRWLMGRRPGEPLEPADVFLGTTLGTNALLERRGARTALVATRGFGDILEIACQDRPKLFDLRVRKPRPLYGAAVEVPGRIDSSGRVTEAFDERRARSVLSALTRRGFESLAVCLLNAYRNPAHERRVGRLAREAGFRHVSISTELVPLQRIVFRGDTTVVNAYLTPLIRDYLRAISRGLGPGAGLKLMTSAGGLVGPEAFVGKDSILSGPAGGVVGQGRVGAQAGFTKVIGFDMGGTSTDVSRFDGRYEYRYQMEINDPESGTGVRVLAPMLRIETVAAGGGSICRFDGQLPRVGPGSAGADPGPACYGAGGPLTLTDANLLLGRIPSERFAFPLDRKAARARLTEVRDDMRAAGRRYGLEELAEGFVRIANRTMAAAIRKISLERGYDLREYALVSFGGAGSQHACAVARELGMRSIVAHPHAGVLSAYGMAHADVRKFKARPIGGPAGARALRAASRAFSTMERSLRGEIAAEGVPASRMGRPRRMLDMRYRGQDWTLTVPEPRRGCWTGAFERLHRRTYGFVYRGRPVEIAAARVELAGRTGERMRRAVRGRRHRPVLEARTRAYFDGAWRRAGLFRRAGLRPGARIEGPAIVADEGSTIVVEPGWIAEADSRGSLVLTDGRGRGREKTDARLDLVTLELFNNMFAAVAEESGLVLEKTALSTNVKERRDFSCAVFTSDGALVANAPHIPVHLGAMEDCVRGLLRSFPDMRPGDAFVTNDPFRGGSHLPDVTVVTPVFDRSGPPLFFAASRAHHAEIGGKTPGSLPPFARSLAEEGVVIPPLRLVEGEASREAGLERLLRGAPYPSRAVRDNLADVRAQLAANRRAAEELLAMTRRYGKGVVGAYMGHIRRAASAMMQRALREFKPGSYRFEDRMDDGSRIRVRIDIEHARSGARAGVDFSGTSPVAPNSLNANPAVVRSAVLYSLRCLIREDIPLNSGVLEPVDIIAPEGSLLNPPRSDDPRQCAAVGGGNVETSQRIVDVMLGALRVASASQGTMNNLLFGRGGAVRGFGYYETIGGGAGAGAGWDGAHAVHTHMTNTRLTDPEVLEERYPVRLRRFAVRRGSGGPGRRRGGDGIVREFEFLSGLRLSLLTGRRETAPYGLSRGGPGKPGRNLLRPARSRRWRRLPWAAETDVRRGDVLRIETPGGGGFGRPSKRKS